MKCLNCNTHFEGDFCPRCGQKASTSRFETKEMFLSIIKLLIGGDHKFLVTCKHLLTRPGHMVREFLLGKRTCYYAPIPLLLFLVALYAIVTFALDSTTSPFDLLKIKLNKDDVATDSAQQFVLFFQAITDNRVYFALFSVLLNLLPYRFIFRKYNIARPDGTFASLNVAEHFFVLVYQTCFNMLLAFALLPFNAVPGSEIWTARLCMVLPTIYCIILYKQICSISWLRSTLLNLLSIVVTLFMSFILLLLTFGLLYGYDYAK